MIICKYTYITYITIRVLLLRKQGKKYCIPIVRARMLCDAHISHITKYVMSIKL